MFWKEKKNWRCRRPKGATAHFRVSVATEKTLFRQRMRHGSRHGFPCRDVVRRSGVRPGLGTHDRHVCVRQDLPTLCRDRDLRVATSFPGKLGGWGRDKGFLCHDRNCSALYRNRNSVLRQGLGLSHAWVVTMVNLCRDNGQFVSQQSFPKGGPFLSRQKTLCRDRVSKGGVATRCFSIATHKPGLRVRQSARHAHNRSVHALEYAHQRQCYARDKAASAHSTHDHEHSAR